MIIHKHRFIGGTDRSKRIVNDRIPRSPGTFQRWRGKHQSYVWAERAGLGNFWVDHGPVER